MALKLYGMPPSTNTARVVAVLMEIGLEYELVLTELHTDAHQHPDFLTLNPLGQILVLRDGDLTLFESRAIIRYLAKKHAGIGTDLLGTCGGQTVVAAVEVWLEVESQQFNAPITALVYELLIKPKFGGVANPAVAEAEAAKLGKVLDVYEARLEASKYLAWDEFTLADLHHMPYIDCLMRTA